MIGKMGKRSKPVKGLWIVVKSVLAGSVVVSRTFAAPAPIAPNHVDMVDSWRELGQQMRTNPSALPPLDDSIVDMIAAADLEKNLSTMVFATYEMVDHSQLRALDAHWAAILTASGSATLVAEFLNLRSELGEDMEAAGDGDAVLWLARNPKNDGCDGACNNGWGNDTDCAPGNSLDNNNGENYEGGPGDPTGGNDPDGTDDGKTNSGRRNR